MKPKNSASRQDLLQTDENLPDKVCGAGARKLGVWSRLHCSLPVVPCTMMNSYWALVAPFLCCGRFLPRRQGCWQKKKCVLASSSPLAESLRLPLFWGAPGRALHVIIPTVIFWEWWKSFSILWKLEGVNYRSSMRYILHLGSWFPVVIIRKHLCT